jgi:hypothetical protein
MERIEKYQFNIWDVLTMIPIFICAFLVNNIYISVSFIFVGIVGIFHHWFINSYRFLLLDTISISIAFVVYTIFCKIPEYIKSYLYITQASVIIFLFICMLFNIKYSYRFLLTLISIIWLPLLIFSIKYISHTTGWIALFTLFLYMASSCICENQSYIKLSWPLFHVIIAILAFFTFYEMDFLRPEVYKPIEHILDKIIDIKESLISS